MISLTTACMNRHEHLDACLPTWLGKGFREIVVVDYSSTPSLREIVARHQDGTVMLVELLDRQEFFNDAKAKNLRMRVARTPIVCSFDCDVKIVTNDFVTKHPLEEGQFYKGESASCCGSGIFWRADWEAFNGCDETMQGWGFDDCDLYNRWIAAGRKWLGMDPASVAHIPHDDLARVANFPESDRDCKASAARNRTISATPHAWQQQEFRVLVHRPGKCPQESTV